MIIDKITCMDRYIPSLPALEHVITILQSGTLENQALGNYTTEHPNLRYNLFAYQTEKHHADEYEIHKKEIDVQILLTGQERMDIAMQDPIVPVLEYDEDKDFLMAKAERVTSYHAKPGSFVIFFPGEPHAPNLIDETATQVRKVVFKILA